MMLQQLLQSASARHPDRLAIDAPDSRLTYGELDLLAQVVAGELRSLGVGPADRVALWHDKSACVVAAMQAALRCGAAYVPLDPTAPLTRVENMLRAAGCSAIATTRERYAMLRANGWSAPWIDVAAESIARRLSDGARAGVAAMPSILQPDGLAYILFTSGSTGSPKGVCISHRNALAFVSWAANDLSLTSDDRLSNHAPFHFDLSVLDLYGAFSAAASVHIVSETAAYAPKQLVSFLLDQRISVWYSVPSALMLMVEHGGLLTKTPSALRKIVVAGEVYPVQQLRALQRGLPAVSIHNYYGPTETNVCAAYAVPTLSDDVVAPVPIGWAASGAECSVLGDDGCPVAPGVQGELWVSGPTVMLGYWAKPRLGGPYATGDIVTRDERGLMRYVGRRDRQVKVRGHRIELGEIEAVLSENPRLKQVAVAVEGSGMEAKLVAYVSARAERPSLIALKRACSERLPRYMIIDAVHYLDELPRTCNGKVDRAALTSSKLSRMERL